MHDITIESPITKDQLQKGFLIKYKIMEDIKNKVLNEFITKTINEIILLIVSNTIDEQTYKELKKDTTIEYTNYEDEDGEIIQTSQKVIKKTKQEKNVIKDKVKSIQKIKYEFKSNNNKHDLLNVLNNIGRQYIMQYSPKLADYNCMKIITITETDIDNIKDQIYSKLKEIFPDCIIQMDPLKTYILIDWN
jgi:hypothetical protein